MELFFFFLFFFTSSLYKRKPFTLYLLAQKKMKLPGCQMQGCHRQLDGRNLGSKCFVFPLAGPVRSQRLQGKGCPERKRRIHQAGPWALFREGVGTAGPHAGSGRCRRLTRFLFLNLCCSITRQWTQEGFSYRQQVKSSVGQKRVLRDVFGFMPCFYMDLRMAESTSAFWGGLIVVFFFFFPFKWLPCQPSAVQNFHATSEVLFQLCWLGCHGIFLGGL